MILHKTGPQKEVGKHMMGKVVLEARWVQQYWEQVLFFRGVCASFIRPTKKSLLHLSHFLCLLENSNKLYQP